MEILNVEQGSPEWHEARRGIITSSDFQAVMTKGRAKGEPSKTRETLIYKKAAERLTGEVTESYSNGYMQRGTELEASAREIYEIRNGVTVTKCGFIRNGNFGTSTDGLVEDNGIVEIKTRIAYEQIRLIIAGETELHKAQIQGALWVTYREWIDYFSYSPGLPIFCKREYRDNDYIEELSNQLFLAEEEINQVVQNIKKMF